MEGSSDEAVILEMIRDRVIEAFNPLRLILFGSRARGTARADSDIDLLVVMPTVGNKREVAVEIRRVLRDLPVGKDIVVTTPDELVERGGIIGSILRTALRDGITIFERS
ncbi:MAG: nucleotidyltransferase domain-containing protein [Planctomycetota bacterium]|jgi:predicted nucleotidyltransferase